MTSSLTHEQHLASVGEDFLQHFGVKGMRWGVRNPDDSSGSSVGASPAVASVRKNSGKRATDAATVNSEPDSGKMTAQQKKDLAKKAAIGVGVLALAAGAGYAAYTLNKNGKLPISSLRKATPPNAVNVTKQVLKEPVSVVHASRSHATGFRFLKSGGLSDAFQEYERAGFTGHESGETFLRYGLNKEKVAARFLDPEGRKDLAGRPIPHDVFVPASLAEGLSSLADVKDKIWPLLKPDYDEFYNTAKPTQRIRP